VLRAFAVKNVALTEFSDSLLEERYAGVALVLFVNPPKCRDGNPLIYAYRREFFLRRKRLADSFLTAQKHPISLAR
jgi:hypothetical protein